jgi:CAAX protease family protein
MDERFTRLRLKWLVLWPLAGLVVLGLLHRMPPRADPATFFVPLTYVLYGLLLLGALHALRAAGVSVSEVFGQPPRDPHLWFRAFLAVPLLILGSSVLLWATIFVASTLAPSLTTELLANRPRQNLLAPPGSFARLLLLLSICVVGPVVEELVFRGLILRRLVARRGFWPGVIWSALIFALLHPHMLFGAWVFAVICSLLYLATGSLLVPIAVHILHNTALAVPGIYRAPPVRDEGAKIILSEVRELWAVMVVALVVVGILLLRLARPLVDRARDHALRAVATGEPSAARLPP